MKILVFIFIYFFSFLSNSLFAQKDNNISIGEKFSIESKILNEKRFFNIYLPPSYGTLKEVTYPVIYLMDGDYNFHHTTGLIEQLSSISEKIPEMIVIGISDAGHDNYVKNTTPFNKESNPTGQSEKFLEFIFTELKSFIDKNYSSANFNILIGHSLGGLFTVNALLNKPEYFNVYIAISPSLWWNDYESKDKIKPFFDKYDNIDRKLFLSLANEKGMGVLGFLDQLDVNTFADQYYKNTPLGLDYSFKHFENENHNSVGLVSVDYALKKIFAKYDNSNSKLDNIKNVKNFDNLFNPYSEMIGTGFRIPTRQLNYIIQQLYKNKFDLKSLEELIANKYSASLSDYYNSLGNVYVKDEKLDDGIKLLKSNIERNPNSPEYLTSLADAYFKSKKLDSAKLYYTKSYELAKKQKARFWYLNQLKANLVKIKNEKK